MWRCFRGSQPKRRALRAVFPRLCAQAARCVTVTQLPSKSVALLPRVGAPGLIFRSDSNAEDLEGYAGAGLFDSVATTTPVRVPSFYFSRPV